MTTAPRRRGVGAATPTLVLTALLALSAPGEAQLRATDRGCALCHGELEFLRQQVTGLDAAQRLLVPPAMLLSSAHDTLSCGSCHDGFGRFPHREAGVDTRTCADCHEEEQEAWVVSVHAEDPDGQAGCTSCHGVHDVAPAADIRRGEGALRLNDTCLSCHQTSPLPPTDPHRDTLSCASCHDSHGTVPVDGPGSAMAPLAQHATCGACHEEAADSAREDAHGRALGERGIQTLALLEHEEGEAPPTCTSCHGAHGMITPGADDFPRLMTDRCGSCHEHSLETFFDTYHGQATALGSRVTAMCSDCHGAHGILPEDEPASHVAEANLVETCGSCHPHASASFTEYQPHADHSNPEDYPLSYWSYLGMTALLVGTLSVFGIHTALWLYRATVESLRASASRGAGEPSSSSRTPPE